LNRRRFLKYVAFAGAVVASLVAGYEFEKQSPTTSLPVCTRTMTEGEVEILETCPSGAWKRRRVFRNEAWVEETRPCSQTIHHIFLYVCEDSELCGLLKGDIIGADIYWDGSHTVTGFGGHATLDVYAGTYTIRAEKTGYEAKEVTVTVVDQSLWITIRLPKLPANPNP